MRKKVAIMLTTLPEYGGEHQYVMLQMQALLKCNGKYFDVLAICYNRFWSKLCKEYGVEYQKDNLVSFQNEEMINQAKYPGLFGIYNRMSLSLCKIITENKIDILICGQQGIFVPKVPCKVMHAVHDLMHRYEPDFPEIRVSSENREILFQSITKLSDVILVDSQLGKKQLTESYCTKRIHPRIEVLPFAVPGHISNVREEYIETPLKYVFYPAQFWAHKNHINLIKAIEILKKQRSDVRLVLVGSDKNYKSKIEKYIIENKLEKYVFIKGFVSDEQITYLYRHALALVMPTYFGPTNIPPLEAMALGCPTVVSNKYAMKEQVGNAGLLFNPDSPMEIAECILRLDKDSQLRNTLIKRGYKKVAKWQPKDFKEQFIKIVLKEL